MRSFLLFALLAVPTTALADPTPTADVSRMASDDCARARKAGKTCVLDMGAETLDGEAPTAGDVSLNILVFGTGKSLIHIRETFIPEILKSAEDID